jgi:hypothetical protein
VEYSIKVRGTKYLWGSKGVQANLKWPLVLVFRVNEFGEPITFGTESKPAPNKECTEFLGSLDPGEAYAISLLNLSGVYAHCDLDSSVSCTIISPQLPSVTSDESK